MEIQQTDWYARYIRSLGWKTSTLSGSYIYERHLPFAGTIAKLQRCRTLPSAASLISFLTSHHIRTLAIEPDSNVPQQAFDNLLTEVKDRVRLSGSAFLPTKTIRVDIRPPLPEIFTRMSEAKRRAVRRAEKNAIRIDVSEDIDLLIRTKSRAAGFLGSITTYGAKQMWQNAPKNARSILLAFAPGDRLPIGGILLFVAGSCAYYWIAGATKKGKKLFAPTLLVWKSFAEAKRLGATTYDFVGVWDERMPKDNREWVGFTKFKEGFGGEVLYYPVSRRQ
jgi:lipid II:glycine glycyltransferase (peptidoglycan interpeptide bridge formation enzyme)